MKRIFTHGLLAVAAIGTILNIGCSYDIPTTTFYVDNQTSEMIYIKYEGLASARLTTFTATVSPYSLGKVATGQLRSANEVDERFPEPHEIFSRFEATNDLGEVIFRAGMENTNQANDWQQHCGQRECRSGDTIQINYQN